MEDFVWLLALPALNPPFSLGCLLMCMPPSREPDWRNAKNFRMWRAMLGSHFKFAPNGHISKTDSDNQSYRRCIHEPGRAGVQSCPRALGFSICSSTVYEPLSWRGAIRRGRRKYTIYHGFCETNSTQYSLAHEVQYLFVC